MTRTTKKWIRIAAIVLVLAVSVGLLVKNMNIEPADYTSRVENEIAEAEKIIDGIEITKGEYTTKNIQLLQAAIDEAKAVLDNPDSAYSDKKEAALLLREAIDKFLASKGVFGDVKEEESKTDSKDKTESSSSQAGSSQADTGSTTNTDANKPTGGSATDNKPTGGSATDNKPTGGNTTDNKPAGSNTSGTGSAGDNNQAGNSGNSSSNTGSNTKPVTPAKEKITVYITIDCKNLVGKSIDGSKAPYVPADGAILPRTAVTIEKGKSVFDVLNKICRDKNIHISSRFTPMYGSYYVEGINHLFEFDGGANSGWMYKVNEWFPNYGCSEYVLKGNEEIVWCYTCDLGKDVGDNSMW